MALLRSRSEALRTAMGVMAGDRDGRDWTGTVIGELTVIEPIDPPCPEVVRYRRMWLVRIDRNGGAARTRALTEAELRSEERVERYRRAGGATPPRQDGESLALPPEPVDPYQRAFPYDASRYG